MSQARLAPKTISCPTCGAPAKVRCRSIVDQRFLSVFHPARVQRAPVVERVPDPARAGMSGNAHGRRILRRMGQLLHRLRAFIAPSGGLA